MLKIAICDDEVKELNRTNKMCNDFKDFHSEYDFKISSFLSTGKLKSHIEQQERFDILLLDIYMPNMTGIELARFLRGRSDECQIIFLTTSISHAVEAFSLHVTHYLVKPFTVDQFKDAMTKAINAIEKSKKTHLTLKIPGGVQRINLADFIYAETDNHIQHIHLVKGKCLQVRITSIELFAMLAYDNRYFKCGSTYIINFDKVEEVTSHYIRIENEISLPMLRRQYKELLERYTSYLLEGN
ncbi:MAG: putative two-component response regulator [Herbinix sp.]|jgi:DNA-binding LytR/AlgR family response regulator|nr:putative two-component response regulator [Herbinix sp.]